MTPKEHNKKWRDAHPDIVLRQVKAWQKANPRKVFGYILKHDFNISLELYDKMMQDQVGCCALCGTPFGNTKASGPAVDHDHKTGMVRGLLCKNCNTGLGLFGDDIDGINKALSYLRKSFKHGDEIK